MMDVKSVKNELSSEMCENEDGHKVVRITRVLTDEFKINDYLFYLKSFKDKIKQLDENKEALQKDLAAIQDLEAEAQKLHDAEIEQMKKEREEAIKKEIETKSE